MQPTTPPSQPPTEGRPPAKTDSTPVLTSAAPKGDAAMPAAADDGDRIEKEWVGKIRQVVSRVGHDPYELNRQFTQIKADYLQKRYGKGIKVEE